jgi:uncharacterized protein (TIGR03067 family)
MDSFGGGRRWVVGGSLLFAALAVGAPALKDKPPPPANIDGRWAVERVVQGGKETGRHTGFLPDPCEADGAWLRTPGQPPVRGDAVGYRADPRARPARIDFHVTKFGREMTLEGVYKVDGDTLTMCLAGLGAARPDGFEAPAGSDRVLVTFRRVRPD